MEKNHELDESLDDSKIPLVEVTQATPKHVNQDQFFANLLVWHEIMKQQNVKPDSVNASSFHGDNSNQYLLAPRRSKRVKSNSVSSDAGSAYSQSTIVIQKRLVKRCRFLGIDTCCSPKYGWIIGYAILCWILMLVGLQQLFKGASPVLSISILIQLASAGLLFYGIVKRQTIYFIPSLVMNCYELVAHIVIMFAISLCYYGNFKTMGFLEAMKWISVYSFDAYELWPNPGEPHKNTVVVPGLFKAEFEDECNDFEAFIQFAWNIVVIILYVGITYGLNNYRIRLNARLAKRAITQSRNKRNLEASLSNV